MRLLSVLILVAIVSFSCKKHNPQKVIKDRSFNMGFSATNFGASDAELDQTYDTIQRYGDIYMEEITSPIPWGPLVSNSPLPISLTDEIDFIANKKNEDKLVLAFNLLNQDRTNIKSDYAGNYPNFFYLNDQIVEDAYFSYLSYIIYRLKPDFVILSMDSNELLINNKAIWAQYKILMANIRNRVRSEFPELQISESISLHYWEKAPVTDMAAYSAEIKGVINSYDFAAISYYPYFNDQHDRKAFQKSFDFLHSNVEIPIAFVETGHIAENIEGSSVGNSESDEDEQETYLSTLLINANNKDYSFVIWNIHQDYDLFWNTLPDWAQSESKTFRDTGLKDETGAYRKAFTTWKDIFKT